MPDEFYTPEELARIAKVQTQTLAKWRSQRLHGPRFIKIGKHVRYRRSDVESWLHENTVGTDAQPVER